MSDDGLEPSTWRRALTKNENNRYFIEAYWREAHDVATNRFKWRYKGDQLGDGNWMMFELHRSPVDQVSVWAGTREFLAKNGVQIEGDPDEIVEVQLRYREANAAIPNAGHALETEEWRGTNGCGESRGKRFVRIFVDASKWTAADTHDKKSAVLTGAFVACLRMFEQLTRLELPGMHEAS